MKVTVEQMKALRPGAKVTYKADHPKELQNIRMTACYTHLTYPELGVRFKTTICRPKMEITIEVIATEKPKARKGAKP